jgi:hypothetical protein
VAAVENPIALAMYLWIFTISLKKEVTPKSTKIPVNPTMQNLMNLKRKALSIRDEKSIRRGYN